MCVYFLEFDYERVQELKVFNGKYFTHYCKEISLSDIHSTGKFTLPCEVGKSCWIKLSPVIKDSKEDPFVLY